MAIVLVISDTQAPFQHPNALEHLLRTRDKYTSLFPDKEFKVVHIGDEVDFKFLKYSSVNDPHTAERQHDLALIFMHQLYSEFPDVKVCHSNHVIDRIEFAQNKAGIPSFMMLPIPELLEAPDGWEWDYEWIIDDVKYSHGHKYGGQHAHYAAMNKSWQSVCIGHHPIFASRFNMIDGKMYSGTCVGALCISDKAKNKMAYGMKYTKKYASEMPLGCAVFIDGIPYLEHLP